MDINYGIGEPLPDSAIDLMVVILVPQLLALILNLFVILGILSSKELHNFHCFLVLNLAVADFLQTVVFSAISAQTIHQGTWSARACQVQGFFLVFTACSSQSVLLGIAIERYLVVCKGRRTTATWRTLGLLACGYVYSALSGLMPFMNFGDFAIQPSGAICVGDWPDEGTLGWSVWCIVTNVLATAVVVWCYYAIFVTHRATASTVSKNVDSTVAGHQERKLAAKMLFLVLSFAGCWASFNAMFVYEISTGQYAPPGWDAVSTFMACLNVLLNPLIYAWTDIRYRRAFVALLPCTAPWLLWEDSSERDARSPQQGTASTRSHEDGAGQRPSRASSHSGDGTGAGGRRASRSGSHNNPRSGPNTPSSVAVPDPTAPAGLFWSPPSSGQRGGLVGSPITVVLESPREYDGMPELALASPDVPAIQALVAPEQALSSP